MKKKFMQWTGAAIFALGMGSCAYDGYAPSNTRTSVGVSYGTGYGYGYGGSAFSTSFFWSTGNPRWGYDPYSRAYFDYSRRAYYDPWLYGYYPVGFRPPILVGVPHPVGYRSGWCPPPRVINNVTVVNYQHRERAYRQTNHTWARNVSYDRNPRSAGPPATRGAQSQQTRRNDAQQNWRNDGQQGRRNDSRGGAQPFTAPGGSNRGNRNEATPWTGRGPANPPAADPRRDVRGQEGSTRGGGASGRSGAPTTRVPDRYNSPIASQPEFSRPMDARSAGPRFDDRNRTGRVAPQAQASRPVPQPNFGARDAGAMGSRPERQPSPSRVESRAGDFRTQQPARVPETRMRQPQRMPEARAPQPAPPPQMQPPAPPRGDPGVRGLGQGEDRGRRR